MAIYNMLIQPLVLVFDILFVFLYRFFSDPVIAILALSIVINLLVLPLYRKADVMQREEMLKTKKMKPYLDHIRKSFSGDERFMIQQAYYRTEHYSPIYALREAGPLLLQVPFFIAAYNYISTIPVLDGTSFGQIENLMAPDALLHIGDIHINVLPIVMTVINCVSGFVYSKDAPLRQKIQIYGIAAIFLFLLYDSAAGLVIYWIMNQLFSLGKNIKDGRQKRRRLVYVLLGIAFLSLSLGRLFRGQLFSEHDVFTSIVMLVLGTAIILLAVISIYHDKKNDLPVKTSCDKNTIVKRSPVILLWMACIVFFLLLGLYIPTSVIASSPYEFYNIEKQVMRFELVSYPALVYLGLFLIWIPVLVYAQNKENRDKYTAIVWIALLIAMINQFLFDPRVGVLYDDLTFEGTISPSLVKAVVNIAVCMGIAGVFILLYNRKRMWLERAATVIAVSLALICAFNLTNIVSASRNIDASNVENKLHSKILNLSKTGHNVIVLMLDRAIGGLVPYIFDEAPELRDCYSGFVYYPNTVSFGRYTNVGSPALFGGYEYMPVVSNRRSNLTLAEKQNEALKLMPVLFYENGYDVTVCDPPYAGYKDPPDLSIYNDYPEIHTYNLNGKYVSRYYNTEKVKAETIQQRNFLMYSLFRAVPLAMKPTVYDDGNYLLLKKNWGNLTGNRFEEMDDSELSSFIERYTNDRARAINGALINAYTTLQAYPDIVKATDDDQNCFLMMQNDLPHQPKPLPQPDYTIDPDAETLELNGTHPTTMTVDGHTLDISTNDQWSHYCVNAASYRLLGKWLMKLKELGVYDNTRIIIVADHGRNLHQFQDLIHPDGLDVESVWPVLMVKDFEAKGEFHVDNSFMTNADVPTIAMEGLIDNPVNPITGKRVSDDAKSEEKLLITDSGRFGVYEGNVFDMNNAHWWTVHDNIFDMDNWSIVPDEEVGK